MAKSFPRYLKSSKLKANILMGILLGGMLVSFFSQQKFFPFSHFPMYAYLYTEDTIYQDIQVIVTTEEGEEIDLGYQGEFLFLPYFYQQQIKYGTSPQRMAKGLFKIIVETERLPSEGIKTLKLYRVRGPVDEMIHYFEEGPHVGVEYELVAKYAPYEGPTQ